MTIAPPRAGITRLLGAELRWVLLRQRTLVMLGLFALVPVLMAIGIAVTDPDDPADPRAGLITAVMGNGMVLPVAAIGVSLNLLLPLAVAMAAADAIAGESAHGTLRGLLLAPVSRARLVAVKAFGVLVVATLAVVVLAAAGMISGLVLVGSADGQLVTLSGTTIGLGSGMGRVALVAAWAIGQLAAVGAVALAVSAFTDHPVVVLASILGGLIVFGVLSVIPALDWLEPYLLSSGWSAAADVLRDPIPAAELVRGTLRACCYLAIGGGVAMWRMRGRDA